MLHGICYSSCPDYYFESFDTGNCELCTPYCLDCQNSSVCDLCQTGFYIYENSDGTNRCVDQCPEFDYDNTTHCFACVSPCYHCTDLYVCVDCIPGYYLNVQCYPCHQSCKYCDGGTARDCISCTDGYFLDTATNICVKLNCLSNQYVHSTFGCFQCSDSFVNAEQCSSDGPTGCKRGYMLEDNSCLNCSIVAGYQVVNGECD